MYYFVLLCLMTSGFSSLPEVVFFVNNWGQKGVTLFQKERLMGHSDGSRKWEGEIETQSLGITKPNSSLRRNNNSQEGYYLW